jgi:hypothetical protein
METPQTNVRLQPGIKAQAKTAAKAEGISVSQFIERALIAWLAGQCTGANTAIDTGAGVIPDLVSRIEAIEAALAALPPIASTSVLGIPRTEATPTPAPKHPRQDAQQGASTPIQVSQHPPESHPRADGGRWLTTTQAVELSSSRGGPGSVATLRRWGEDGRIAAIGMRYCPHGSKNNSLASFEDLRWG